MNLYATMRGSPLPLKIRVAVRFTCTLTAAQPNVNDSRVASWLCLVDDLRSGMTEKRIPGSRNLRAPAFALVSVAQGLTNDAQRRNRIVVYPIETAAFFER